MKENKKNTQKQNTPILIKRKSSKSFTSSSKSTTNLLSLINITSPFSYDNIYQREFSINSSKIDNFKLDIMSLIHKLNNLEEVSQHFKNSLKGSEKIYSKIKQIETSKSQIFDIYNIIKLKSNNLEGIQKEYKAKSLPELTTILFNEAKYSEIFLRRLNDLFFLLNLKYNEKFNNSYNETESNFSQVLEFIDYFINNESKESDSRKSLHQELSIHTSNSFEVIKQREYNGSSFFFDASDRIDLPEFTKLNPKKTILKKNDGESEANHQFNNSKISFSQSRNQEKPIKLSFVQNQTIRIKSDLDKYKEELKKKDNLVTNLTYSIDDFRKSHSENKNNERRIRENNENFSEKLNEAKEIKKYIQKIEDINKNLKTENEFLKVQTLNLERKLKKIEGNSDSDLNRKLINHQKIIPIFDYGVNKN